MGEPYGFLLGSVGIPMIPHEIPTGSYGFCPDPFSTPWDPCGFLSGSRGIPTVPYGSPVVAVAVAAAVQY
eukprot:8634457-Pyramimonas_sp.AAC.1